MAYAGADQQVDVGSTGNLDGSLSHDADGDGLTFLWRIQSQPAGSNATLQNPTGPTAALVVPVYEGGPSGYWSNPDDPEVDELYGKSLGMGVAALDAWLFSSQHGFRHQCYLGFASGRCWSLHTLPEAGGFRAHAGWLALQMRNRYALGTEMLAVSVEQSPDYLRNGRSVPLMSAYAFQDDDRSTSVFVLSRKLDGHHDGYDFSDGFKPVTLHLPFVQEPSKVTLYKLARPDGTPQDPRLNNRSSQEIVIDEQEILLPEFSSTFVIDEQTGGTAAGMPPGTVYLYVFQH